MCKFERVKTTKSNNFFIETQQLFNKKVIYLI